MTSIVVSVGTYHLPFHRLTEWVGHWFADHPEVELLVQHGPSRPIAGASNVELLPYQELLDRCEDADIVILQGGAGGVMDMNKLGVVPIVVPRIPVDDEVVDDHQLIFTKEAEHLGVAHRATSLAELTSLLNQAVAGTLVCRTDGATATPGNAAFAALTLPPPAQRLSCVFRRIGWSIAASVRRRASQKA